MKVSLRAPGVSRRTVLLCALAAPAAWALPPRTLRFPRDFGSHPGQHTEWWYITGQARTGAREFGFQLTFFRSRVDETQGMRSAFAARQLIFAHAALTDLEGRKLWHDQRIAREGFGVASAAEDDTDVRLRDWTLRRDDKGYAARLPAEGFGLELRFTPTQPVMLQGEAGLSRKGPEVEQASYYYSEPQLAVSGRVTEGGKAREVTGIAWLDHEWSSEPLAAEAAGWDWLGANLEGGGALMAFRMRSKDGGVLWSQATLREAGRAPIAVEGDTVRFTPRRTWTSPRTGVAYPVGMTIAVGGRRWNVEPIMDDQELDARASTGTLYWEGAARVVGEGAPGGRGYLELTGYAGKKPY